MSQFYTYEELKKHFPSEKKVSEARDTLRKEIFKGEVIVNYNITYDGLQDYCIIFGSTMWELTPHGIQHHRRSDIDIGYIEESSASFPYKKRLERLCDKVINEFGIRIELTRLGINNETDTNFEKTLRKSRLYCPTGKISPGTIDHLNYLKSYFEEIKKFEIGLSVETKGRTDDLEKYIFKVKNEFLTPYENNIDLKNPDNLDTLCIWENFPAHLLRKIFGIKKILPCPDSKSQIMNVYDKTNLNLKKHLDPYFKQIESSRSAYEKLIDNVELGMSEKDYYKRLSDISKQLQYSMFQIYDKIPLDSKENMSRFLTN